MQIFASGNNAQIYDTGDTYLKVLALDDMVIWQTVNTHKTYH